MATRNSKSKADARRVRSGPADGEGPADGTGSSGPHGSPRARKRAGRAAAQKTHDDTETASAADTLMDTIETERLRLMKVDAVLSCFARALDDEEDLDCSSIIELARDALRETTRRLDSLHIGPLIAGVKRASRQR